MAVTVSQLGAIPLGGIVPGSIRESYLVLTLDSSYPTGGYALPAALFGLSRLDAVVALSTSGGKPTFWNPSTGKLQAFSAVGTEVTAATNLSTEKVVVVAFGE